MEVSLPLARYADEEGTVSAEACKMCSAGRWVQKVWRLKLCRWTGARGGPEDTMFDGLSD